VHLSAHGDAVAFTEALDLVQAETKLLRPGTNVKFVFGDVDRAWGTDKIGLRTNTIVSEYLSKNSHLSVVPNPPHSPENNGAEACLSRVVVYYMANHVRGQISVKGWGDMLRNAAFCFAHQTQPTSRKVEARTATPYTRFTAAQSILDATRVLGFAGELCCTSSPTENSVNSAAEQPPRTTSCSTPRPTSTGCATFGPSSWSPAATSSWATTPR
jgi:hypothetical protein